MNHQLNLAQLSQPISAKTGSDSRTTNDLKHLNGGLVKMRGTLYTLTTGTMQRGRYVVQGGKTVWYNIKISACERCISPW